MKEQIDSFFKKLRAKADEAEKRIKDLNAATKGTAEKAKTQAKAQLAALEEKAKQHRAKVEAAEAKAKEWLKAKKATTEEKIASWKAQQEVKKLDAHADIAEAYAAASMEAAASGIDEAHRAVVEAIGARLDAEAAK